MQTARVSVRRQAAPAAARGAGLAPRLPLATLLVGMCVDRMSNLYDEQASREGAAFEEPLRDYIRMIGQCKQVLLGAPRPGTELSPPPVSP